MTLLLEDSASSYRGNGIIKARTALVLNALSIRCALRFAACTVVHLPVSVQSTEASERRKKDRIYENECV